VTLRERIADWISGGALTWMKLDIELREENRVMWRDRSFDRNRMIGKMAVALRAIADCETPSANATVRRMARIAREATE
jgi:hypothetical protein